MGQRSGQRTGAYALKLWSSSQVKEKKGCETRWGCHRLLGRKEAQGKNAIKGTERHEENENWYRFGRLPSSKEACATIQTVKAKPHYFVRKVKDEHGTLLRKEWCEREHDVEIEVPVRYDLGEEPFVGYIDLAYDWEFGQLIDGEWHHSYEDGKAGDAGRVRPLGSSVNGITVIHDWKYTSSTAWAFDGAGLDPDALRDDYAASIYGVEAFDGGAKRVFCRWVYCEFDSQTPKEVWCELNETEVRTKLELARQHAEDGRLKMQAFQRGELDVFKDLKKDLTHCFDFKQDCPHKSECKPERAARKPLQLRGRDQMACFENQVENVTGAVKKAPPPPLPGAKKAPPPPPKGKDQAAVDSIAAKFKDLTTPLVEEGTVNPTGGPGEAANTPEDAARIQKVPTAAEAASVAATGVQLSASEKEKALESLETMDVGQLKALATALGIEFLPRAKAETVRKLIRDKREAGIEDEADENVVETTNAAHEQEPEAVKPTKKAPPLPGKKPAAVTIISQEGLTLQDMGSIGESVLVDPPKTTLEFEPSDGRHYPVKGYTLYINCRPSWDAKETVYGLDEIIGEYMPDFAEAYGQTDYRALEFGKGRGIIAEAIVDDIANGKFEGRQIVINTHTEEGSAFLGVLARSAARTVQGF